MQFEFTYHGDEVRRIHVQELQRRLIEAAMHLQGEIIEKVSKPGYGEIYRVPGTRNKTYTASAPGDPPATMLGNLKRNIVFETKFTNGELEVIVGVRGVPYAKRLEFGFVGVDKRGRRYNQAPRPFFKPTYEEQRAKLKSIIKNG